MLQGKELSYNNLLDLDSAVNLVREFQEPAAVVLKHNNPCGAATASTLVDAFDRAWDGDPLSAFGGILGFNREVDEATATRIVADKRFVECAIAPDFTPAALEILKTKENMRLLRTGPIGPAPASYDYRRIDGGLLVQDRDLSADDLRIAKPATRRKPSAEELADLAFAWKICKHVKSNAIVLAKAGMIVGVGAGQMSRVDAVQAAVKKAGAEPKARCSPRMPFSPSRTMSKRRPRPASPPSFSPAVPRRTASRSPPATNMESPCCSAACDISGIKLKHGLMFTISINKVEGRPRWYVREPGALWRPVDFPSGKQRVSHRQEWRECQRSQR